MDLTQFKQNKQVGWILQNQKRNIYICWALTLSQHTRKSIKWQQILAAHLTWELPNTMSGCYRLVIMCDTAAVVQVCGPTAQSVAFFNTNNATPKSKTSIQPCIIGKFKTMFPETCNYCQSSNLTANTNILGIIQSNFLVNKVTCSSTAQYPDELVFSDAMA